MTTPHARAGAALVFLLLLLLTPTAAAAEVDDDGRGFLSRVGRGACRVLGWVTLGLGCDVARWDPTPIGGLKAPVLPTLPGFPAPSTSSGGETAELDPAQVAACEAIFPDETCTFLLDPWGSIRRFFFGTLARAVSWPFLQLSAGMTWAGARALDGVAWMWDLLATPFRHSGAFLREQLPRAWPADLLDPMHEGIAAAGEAMGPLGPTFVFSVYASLVALALYAVSLIAEALSSFIKRKASR